MHRLNQEELVDDNKQVYYMFHVIYYYVPLHCE